MRRLVILTSLVAVIVLGLFTYGAASAGTATVTVVGQEHFTANALVDSTFHFAPGPISVRSGDTITFTNTVGDPHTVSVVNKSDLPTNIGEVFNCNICNQIFANSNGTGVLGNGANGRLAGVGDSVFIAPAGAPGSTLGVKITAPSGSTLRYLCAIHPWMQGTINVR